MSGEYLSYEYHGMEKGFVSMPKNHYHDSVEVYYLEKGECNYFVGDKTYKAVSGDVIVIPENVIHRTTYFAPYSRSLIYFDRKLLSPTIAEKLSEMHFLYRNKETQKKIKELFDRIRTETENPDFYTNDSVKGIVNELFILMMRNGSTAENNEKENSFVESAVNFILKNYTSPMTLTDASKHLSVSPEHLSRTFKRETGFGFNEYVTLLRLKKAEELLKTHKVMSVSEVAFLCGFNDSNYFSDKFKKTYGMSPLSFRKNLKKESMCDRMKKTN